MDADLAELIDRAVAPLDPVSRDQTVRDVPDLVAAGVRTVADLLAAGPGSISDPGLRELAYWLLGRSGLAPAVRALDVALDDPDARPRREAVAALASVWGATNYEATVRRVEHALADDPDVSVRIAAALALGARATAVGPLILALRDFAQPPAVRGAAAEALAHQPGDAPRAALLDALSDAEPQVRGWAAFAVGERGDKDALPTLDRLASTDPAAVPGLGSVADEARAAAAAIRARTAST